MQKKIKPLIKYLSVKYKLPANVIEAIVKSQFECAREKTKEGESGKPDTFLNIRFKHLGLLVARPSRIMKIHNAKNRTRNSS